MNSLKIFLSTAVMLISLAASAQFHVNAGSDFVVTANTPFCFDSLMLTPNANMQLSGVTIDKSYTPIPGVGSGASVKRVYTFSAPVAFSGTASMYYDNAELNGNTAALLQIVYKDGSGWTTTTGSTVNLPAQSVSYLFSTPVNLAKLTSVQNGVVLPVGIIDFAARAESGRARLEWTVAFEEHAEHYEIWRSEDGSNFNLLGKVHADKITGQQTHILYDDQPMSGLNYYKLLVTDPAGKTSDAGTRMLQFGGVKDALVMNVFPNPATSKLTILFNTAPPAGSRLLLTDITGRVVRTISTVAQENYLDLEQLTPAIYFLSYYEGERSVRLKVEKL